MRIQGLEIVQNLIADASPIDIGKYLDLLGENTFLQTLSSTAQEGESEELRIPVGLINRHAATTDIIGSLRYVQFGAR